jgi:signal peptidase I
MSRKTKRQVFAVALFAIVALFFVVTFRLAVVRGESMLPTYRDGQLLLANRFTALTGPLRRGDVVLVKTANEVIIKRIAYMPGDIIPPPDSFAFRRVKDYFEVERPREEQGYLPTLKVPSGFVVVLGDNRRNSEDSRSFGPIAFRDILGRIINAPPR